MQLDFINKLIEVAIDNILKIIKSETYSMVRSMFQTDDIGKQRELLDRVSGMIDAGELVSTVTNNLGGLNLESLKDAHRLQESGSVIGKNVLEGF